MTRTGASLSVVVAASTNHVIGRDGGLPWHIPEDLKRFRRLTLGKPIVMGRRTHESIGRALPGRRNIVVTRQPAQVAAGCETAESPNAALRLAVDADEVMIVGGARLYDALMPGTSRIHMTRVHAVLEGDTYFPQLDPREWRVVWSEDHPALDEGSLSYTFETLERRA